jgi:hypothetical protein
LGQIINIAIPKTQRDEVNPSNKSKRAETKA